MATGSTVCPDADPNPPGLNAAADHPAHARLPRVAFWVAAAAILVLAAAPRVYELELRPFHHDEGVNGFFVKSLYRDGAYRYDPSNYHGPSLYYASVVSALLLGLNVPAMRLVTVFFGLVTIALALRARSFLGPVGALAAALLLALSPGAVFFSRYFIHEILLVAATLGVVVAGHKFGRERSLPALIETSAWAGLVFTTKETATPTAIVLVLALGCAVGLEWLRRSVALRRRAPLPELVPWNATRAELVQLVTAAGSLFLLMQILLYSSFFTNPRGVIDAVRALFIWSGTGMKSHVHAWWTHAQWLWKMEAPLVVLGVLGLVAALVNLSRRRAPAFVAFWALGIFAAYSIVPYKTPWLTLNVVLPLALLGGHAVDQVARRLPAIAWLALLAAAALSLRSAIELDFKRYDDDRMPYVYAHTRRGFVDLMRTVERAAALSGQGEKTSILVVAPEHWPLPWYLRNYPHTAYHDRMGEGRQAAVVIGGQRQDGALAAALGAGHVRLGKFPLRPGVELVLFVRADIADRASSAR